MPQRIALAPNTRQELLTTLEGQAVKVTIWYQRIGAAWYLSLDLGDGTSIARGRQIAPGVCLIRNPAFAGDLVVFPSQEGDTRDPGINAWTTHRLYYLTPAEVSEVPWLL